MSYTKLQPISGTIPGVLLAPRKLLLCYQGFSRITQECKFWELIMIEDRTNIKAWAQVDEENFMKKYPTQSKNIEETLKGADICFIFIEWSEVKSLKLATL